MIRSAALSLLIASPSTTRPVPKDVLFILRHNLASIHADIDVGVRNDTLWNTKRLMGRLRGGMSLLTKQLQRCTKAELIEQQRGHGSTSSFQTDRQPNSIAARRRELQIAQDSHDDFLDWYVRFLWSELGPTSTYQSHIMALKALLIVFEAGSDQWVLPPKATATEIKWPIACCFERPTSNRLLLDLLMDPFEDVRAGAALILKKAHHRSRYLSAVDLPGGGGLSDSLFYPIQSAESFNLLRGPMHLKLSTIAPRAATMMRDTGRADHSDGFARFFDLIFASCPEVEPAIIDNHMKQDPWTGIAIYEHVLSNLEVVTEVAQESIPKAASSYPMQGFLIALRYRDSTAS